MTTGLLKLILPFFLFVSPLFSAANDGTAKKYWVFFSDKGSGVPSAGALHKSGARWNEAAALLSERALERRTKVLPHSALVDASDLPVYQPYLDTIARHGGLLHHTSRWLNAASFSLTADQVREVARLRFVEKIQPVALFSRDVEIEPSPPAKRSGQTRGGLDYGPSLEQSQMIRATDAHALGVTGEGVIVGMLDTGYRWRVHEALRERDVIAEWDFIQNDGNTANEAGDAPNQDDHGTITMSVVAGFKGGQLIGPAFNASLLLAKTEYVPSETRIEEDYWVTGIEWLERMGADIVSSSLGYDVFDDGFRYSWDNGDFDGRTAVTSRAAVRAARLGVLVCTAMGNEGNGNGIRGTMLTPADADSILAVGATTFARTLAGFSSTGPTNDGRVKPDMVAPGVQVQAARPGVSNYSRVSGTSLSTPLVAASAAVVLSARPELKAMELRSILLQSADTVASFDPRITIWPNNFVGHGLVNILGSLASVGPVFSNRPTVIRSRLDLKVVTHVLSQHGVRQDSVWLTYRYDTDPTTAVVAMQLDSSMHFATSGRYIAVVPISDLNARILHFMIEAVDSGGNVYRSPSTAPQKMWQFDIETGLIRPTPDRFALRQNYPNPFNSRTVIEFTTPDAMPITLTIYNVLGQRVVTLLDGLSRPGRNIVLWDGRNEAGSNVPSGFYWYALRSASSTEIKKMVVLR